MNTVLGTGVFNADGDLWKCAGESFSLHASRSEILSFLCRFHRTMTRPYFTKDRISHFEMFDRHAGMLSIRIVR